MKLSDNAVAPIRGTPLSAGLDLASSHDLVIEKRSRGVVHTDIRILLPENCYGRIADRSGLALNKFITTAAGVCDPDYTGGLSVVLFNHSNEAFIIKKGDRVAQLIIEQYCPVQLLEVYSMDNKTLRNDKGFGSTGI